jgi:hypothetical protein
MRASGSVYLCVLGIVLAGWRESLNGCMKITLASTSRSHIADCEQNPALFGVRARAKNRRRCK